MDREYEIRAAAYEAVAHGEAEIVEERDGEPVFKLTNKGHEHAEEIIDSFIIRYGHEAAWRIAAALDVDIEVGEALVSLRQPKSSASF